MTIKEEEKPKSFGIKAFIAKHVIITTIIIMLSLTAILVTYIEGKNDAKWANLKDNHPSIRIERRGESNLLTSTYTLIKIDGTRHISVQDGTNTGSSYSYTLSDIQIYEVIR